MLILHKIKRKIGNLCLNHLFNAVTEDDIFVRKGQNVYLKGVALNPKVLADIASQAEIIDNLELYHLLIDELKFAANTRIFKKSVTENDLLFGKAVLLTVEIMEKKIDAMKKLYKKS